MCVLLRGRTIFEKYRKNIEFNTNISRKKRRATRRSRKHQHKKYLKRVNLYEISS